MFDFLSRRVSELNRRLQRRAAQARVEAMEPRTLLSVDATVGAPATWLVGNRLA
ncbi:MAG: LEPR-XLL domain-containing protein [Tepidisphaeraceae bacterium]